MSMYYVYFSESVSGLTTATENSQGSKSSKRKTSGKDKSGPKVGRKKPNKK